MSAYVPPAGTWMGAERQPLVVATHTFSHRPAMSRWSPHEIAPLQWRMKTAVFAGAVKRAMMAASWPNGAGRST